MNSLFSADSALMRGLSVVADVMFLNLLFVATSIPVVTLGASLTALNFTGMRIATGECGSVSSDYFRSFHRNFRQATLIGLLLLLVTAAFAAWYAVIPSLRLGTIAELVVFAIWYVLAFNFAMAVLFVFPYLANFEGRTRDVFRNARLMSWKHPFTTLAALTVVASCVVVTVFYPHLAGYGLFWLLFGFGAIATANGYLFARVFNKYITASQSNET